MDLDTTIKGFDLTHDSIRKIFTAICNIEVADDIRFSITRITDIREGDEYPGIRVSLNASYPPLDIALSVDVTTGDKITPREVEYTFRLLFEERSISILAYNLETILAEKLETVLSRNVTNTRPRDFYDVYILYTLRGTECNSQILENALKRTCEKRGSLSILSQYASTMDSIRGSANIRDFWSRYQKEFEYANDITFDDTCNVILEIMLTIEDN